MATATKATKPFDRLSTMVDAAISSPEADAIRFSRDHPDGSPVVVSFAGGRDGKRVCKVRGKALVINSRAVVYVSEVSGAVPIDCCSSCFTAWVKLNRKGQVNHWVQGWWVSEQFMTADIQSQIDRDPRVESYEVRNMRPVE